MRVSALSLFDLFAAGMVPRSTEARAHHGMLCYRGQENSRPITECSTKGRRKLDNEHQSHRICAAISFGHDRRILVLFVASIHVSWTVILSADIRIWCLVHVFYACSFVAMIALVNPIWVCFVTMYSWYSMLCIAGG
jgi:hypothetical protein